MTCIVGIVDYENKNVIIGGDSAGVSDNNIFIRKDKKIFKNGDFIFGCTSSFRMIQLLRFSFTPPKILDKDIYEYMCTDFVDELRKCFKNGGFIQSEKNGSELGGTFLVGFKDRLFKVEDDFQVGENIYGFDSCGCGQDFALGSLASLKNTELTPIDKLKISLEASEMFSTGVSSPFNFISTK